MREYETTFIVQPEISEAGIQALCERLEGILDRRGADRLYYDDLGRRRLAYEIRNFQKGQYFTLFYLDDGRAVPEVERALRLDDSVLRFLTVLANPDVADVAARKAEAAEFERLRAERAAERAAREAEERARSDAAAEADEALGEDSEEGEADETLGMEADEDFEAEANDADELEED